jgi:hypothetical protein
MTSTENIINFPKGMKAYREYEVEMSDGAKVSLAFTLDDFNADTAAARLAHEHNALAFGLVSILKWPDAPEQPLVWMVDTTHLYLAAESGDQPISDELQDAVELYLRLFFIQMVPIAPELESSELGTLEPAANDNRTLH